MGQHTEPDHRFTGLLIGGAVVVFNLGGLFWSANWWSLLATAVSCAGLFGWVVWEWRKEGLRARVSLWRRLKVRRAAKPENAAQRQDGGPQWPVEASDHE